MLGGGGGGGGGNRLAKWRGSNRLPGLVTKQQAVEFPQVLTSINKWQIITMHAVHWFQLNMSSFGQPQDA